MSLSRFPRFMVQALAVAVALGASALAHAATFTATDNTASVNITSVPSGPNQILTITLNNLTTADATTGAANLLVGLQLIPTNLGGSGYSLTNQNGANEFVFSSQKVGAVSGGSFDPSWALTTTSPAGLYFDGFGSGGLPIIGGPATGGTNYNNAGASLTSGPHGTYIYQTATFTVQAPGAFNLNSITGVNFLFNTDGSIVVRSGGPPPTVPVPAAVWAGGAMLTALGARRMIKKVQD